MKYTVLGSRGFIGSHVAALARSQGHEVLCPERNDDLSGAELGHVIYAIGVTADFRTRPYDTVTAHVSRLQEVLTGARFDSLVYLSSTRVYARCAACRGFDGAQTVSENILTPVLSEDPSDLYNASKLLGESLALLSWPKTKIARLSNVIGPDFSSDNFVMSVVRDSLKAGRVLISTSPESAKDYVSVGDVAEALLRLGTEGHQKIYNVASGVNVTHREIMKLVQDHTHAEIVFADKSPEVIFPRIDTSRIRQDLGFTCQPADVMIPKLISEFQKFLAGIESENAE